MRLGAYFLIAIVGLGFAGRGHAEEMSQKPVDADALLARLEARIPNEPTTVTPDLVLLIDEVGATKRLDAAMLLIRALSLSFSPIGSNETRSMFDLFPAATALKRHYGPSVLPLLMFSGVTTEKGWLQTRIALVMRGIGSEADIQSMRQAFSVGEKANPTAQKFAARLAERELRLTEDPVLSLADELNKRIDEALKKHKTDKDRKPPDV